MVHRVISNTANSGSFETQTPSKASGSWARLGEKIKDGLLTFCTYLLKLSGLIFMTIVTYGALYRLPLATNSFFQNTVGVFVFTKNKGTLGTLLIAATFVPFALAIGWMTILITADAMARSFKLDYKHRRFVLKTTPSRGFSLETERDFYRERRAICLHQRKAIMEVAKHVNFSWDSLSEDGAESGEGTVDYNNEIGRLEWHLEEIDVGQPFELMLMDSIKTLGF